MGTIVDTSKVFDFPLIVPGAVCKSTR